MFQTFALLAARYVRPDSPCLTHTYRTRDGFAAGKSLCGKPEASAADPHATDGTKHPTCPACLRKDPRFKGPEALNKMFRF